MQAMLWGAINLHHKPESEYGTPSGRVRVSGRRPNLSQGK